MLQSRRTVVAGLLVMAVLANGCYGPFQLTRKVHEWNGQVSDNKWVVEAVFVLFAWLPVYGIATMADALVLNSVEFWTGKSLLAETDDGSMPLTWRVAREGAEVTFTRVRGPEGDELVIEQTQRGRLLPTVRIRRQGGGTVALDEQGTVLFTSTMLADGRVVVTDAAGRELAAYGPEQVRRYLAALPPGAQVE